LDDIVPIVIPENPPANRQERESEQIMNLFLSEEATNFKARRIALASELKIKLNRPAVRKQLPIPKPFYFKNC
jgi:predicted nucleotidyltransferase